MKMDINKNVENERVSGEEVAMIGRQRCDGRVYEALAEHQMKEKWDLSSLFNSLHTWAERFNSEFKLEIPELALRVEKIHWRHLGEFLPGRNGFGLKGEVTLNIIYLYRKEFLEVLGTLLHEQLHAWQEVHGGLERAIITTANSARKLSTLA